MDENKLKINDKKVENMTIGQFNALSLKEQQQISNEISNIFSCKINNYFKKISNITRYLLNYTAVESNQCFKIVSPSDEKLIHLSNEYRIQILSNLINSLLKSSDFVADDFINLLKEFQQFTVELKYPSDSFQENYENIFELKNSQFAENQFTISVLFSG